MSYRELVSELCQHYKAELNAGRSLLGIVAGRIKAIREGWPLDLGSGKVYFRSDSRFEFIPE